LFARRLASLVNSPDGTADEMSLHLLLLYAIDRVNSELFDKEAVSELVHATIDEHLIEDPQIPEQRPLDDLIGK